MALLVQNLFLEIVTVSHPRSAPAAGEWVAEDPMEEERALISREGGPPSREGAPLSREGAPLTKEGAPLTRDISTLSRNITTLALPKEETPLANPFSANTSGR